jgi:hypothetical protein
MAFICNNSTMIWFHKVDAIVAELTSVMIRVFELFHFQVTAFHI